MKKVTLFACLLAATMLIVFSCSKDKTAATITDLAPVNMKVVRQDVQNALQTIQKIQGVDMNVDTRGAGQFIVVPSGSTNALAQALQDAGMDGIVYLRSGLHTESTPITVRSRAIVIGETGAILKIKSTASLMDLGTGVTQINPAIHVLNAPQSAFLNIEFQPTDANGSTAILYENSPLSAAMGCTFKSFMFSIMIEKSNQMCVMNNKMTCSTLWQTNPGPEIGVLVSNGKSAWIANNEVESAFVGIFMGDQYGSCVQNNAHNNYWGIVLCHIAPNSLKMPDGRLTGAEIATNNWKVRNNQANNNLNVGYLVIDGSNDNTLEANTGTGNGVYDIELAGFTRRLGFPLPPTFNNRVFANANQKVKDCGNNNTVVGGILSNDGCLDAYPNDVATKWTKLQLELTRTTTGYNAGVTVRAVGYFGLTLYESLVLGVSNYQSVATQFGISNPTSYDANSSYYFPASANAAMASITRNFFPTTSAANKFSIDSLEASFAAQFQNQAAPDELNRSAELGRKIASNIFEWSKTDGSHEGYLNLPTGYIPPVGVGLWTPTPPAFAPAALPYVGSNKSFIKDIANNLQLPAPTPYSEDPQSAFYKMANDVYALSQTMTTRDTVTVKYWADIAGLLSVPAHFTNIATQIIEKERLALFEAAVVYAKHGIAIREAGIVVFKTKYNYNLIRPITYIRSVLGHPTWNSVLATPASPEYSSAKVVTVKAVSVVLESIFGTNYGFTDNTYSNVYGTRSYTSFSQYVDECVAGRLFSGFTYKPTVDASLQQGKKIGDLVNAVKFKK